MNENVSKGAFLLIISGLVCKIFGALFRLPLTNIIGIKGIGMFQMVMSIYSLLLVFVSGGVTNSLSKLVAQARGSGDYGKIGSYYKNALVFSLCAGGLLGMLCLIFSNQISSLQGLTGGSHIYFLMVVLLPIGGLISVYRGIIQGHERMMPTAVSQILEQSIKFLLGLLFAFIFSKQSEELGVLGAFLGVVVSEISACIYLVFCGRKHKKTFLVCTNARKEFFSALVPLNISSVILPFTSAVEALVIIPLLLKTGITKENATYLYGLQTGVVGALLHFPLIISLAIAVALLPKISYLSQTGDEKTEKEIVKKSFSLMWFFLLPLTIGLIAISKILFPIIYPGLVENNLNVIYQLIWLGGVGVILSALTQFFQAIIQAKGFFNHSLVFNLIGGIVKVLLLCIFAPIASIGIFAISLSSIFLYSTVLLCTLIKLGKLIKVDAFEMFLPILSSAIMFMSIKLILSIVSGVPGIIFSVLGGGCIYFLISWPISLGVFKEFLIKFKLKRRNVC